MRKRTCDTIPALSAKMNKILTSFSRNRSLPSSLVKRSKLILLAVQGLTNQAISHQIGLHYNSVATWRNRFLQALPHLVEIESEKPEELVETIRMLLTNEQRPGAPTTFTPEQIVKIIDLACKNPNDFGYEVSHWSLPLLVIEIKKQGIADRISEKSVDCIRRQTSWRSRIPMLFLLMK